jgi:hypothetical protein
MISIAESDRPDPLCPDPIGELAQTLGEINDPDILLKYALWLAPRDADKALSVCTMIRISKQRLTGRYSWVKGQRQA